MAETAYQEERGQEKLDGVWLMAPSPNPQHGSIVGNLHGIFWNYLRGKRCRVFAENVDVHLDENNTFIPDLAIVCDRGKIKGDGIHGAPDLVVEVLSYSTQKHDRGKKMQAYGRAGVKEYWIVDPGKKSIEVYLNHEGQLLLDNIYTIQSQPIYTDGNEAPEQLHLKVSLYDDLVIDIREVFYDID